MFSIFSGLMLALSYVATAAPVQPVELLAWSPAITSPTSETVWACNSMQTVFWATNNVPEEKKNSTGILLSGFIANNSENLDIYHPLATGFPIIAGQVSFLVPQNATPRDNAIVVLFGDSGNASPQFKIV
ncbi:uncharacterized protein EDB91DRAFT_1049691 [Suillus paluster]|uniref:uncharacterized protein n=1 Tax=Suillus paluster TaxID=48578 RepID=UPI001B87D7CD|nr:uncharacterized protein EDB91DRAFT_1049691 [Suillus paluster]KAG1745904.1 hypothetical protein EDB91DRAFT_1049691 [Suillus paluster]